MSKNLSKLNIGILGASGFVGAELLRFLVSHSVFDVKFVGANTAAGDSVASHYPNLAIHYPDLMFEELEKIPAGLNLIFLTLPHGQANQQIKDIMNATDHVVDLTADFRLLPKDYEKIYGGKHASPELQKDFIVGIPEFYAEQLAGAKAVSVPGCYTTATVLALKPLVDAGLIETKRLIVDAASGVSGAGKTLSETTTFDNIDENFFAYKLGQHRHTAEMEQLLGADVLFTPHLAPMNRGILATCYADPKNADITTADLYACYKKTYADCPFIHILEGDSPATKNTLRTNSAQLHSFYEEKTETVIALGAIDNLGKGAAGQAIQCANLIFELDETEGLISA